MMTFVHKLRQI